MQMKHQKTAAGLLCGTALCLALAAPCYAAAPTDGLALYASFDAVSGTTVQDASGKANNGTVVGDIAFVKGVNGNAMEIKNQKNSGSDTLAGDRYIDFGKGIDFSKTDFSVSMWYQSTGASSNSTLLSNKDFASGSNTGFALGCFDKDLRMNLTAKGKTRADVKGNALLITAKDGAWHHLAVNVDRDGQMAFYVDGENAGQTSISATNNVTLDAGLPLVLGAGGNYKDATDNCRMDEVRVYTRTLTTDEIGALYELDKPAEVVDLDKDLLVHNDFDAATADSVPNLAGDKYTAAIHGEGISFVDSALGGKAVKVVNKDAATGSDNDKAVADSYLDYGKALSAALGEKSFTLSYWYQQDPSMNSWGAMMSNKNYASGANRGFAVGYYGADSKMNFATSAKSEIKGINLLNEGWHHFTATFSAGSTMKVYLDGVAVNSASLKAGTIDAGLPVIVGAGGNLKNPITNMQMDNLRIYGAALSPVAVTTLYAVEGAGLRLDAMLEEVNGMSPNSLYTAEAIAAIKATLETAKTALQTTAQADIPALLAQAETDYQTFLGGAAPQASFHLISDVHIGGNDPSDTNSVAYTNGLKDMKTVNPDTTIAFVNTGDFTQNSTSAQYEGFYNLTKADNPVSDEKTLVLLGNHDVRGANDSQWNKDPRHPELCTYWETAKSLYLGHNADFMPESAQDTIYHAKELGGYTFIMLNTELGLKDAMYMSDAQIEWFEATMKACYEKDPTKPVFIFSHQALNDTHWRSDTLDGFDGILNTGIGQNYQTGADAKVKAIMTKYPVGILFSGHIHNGFGVVEAIAREYGTVVDVPSYNESENGVTAKGVGYEVQIYDDQVLLRARNFATGKWLTGYDISIPTPMAAATVKTARDTLASGTYTSASKKAVTDALSTTTALLNKVYDQSNLFWNTVTPPDPFYYHADTWAGLNTATAGLQAAVDALEPSDEDPAFEALRLKWRSYLLGGTGDDLDMTNAAVQSYVDSLNTDANEYWASMAKSSNTARTNLWSDLNMTPIKDYTQAAYTRSGNVGTTLRRLRTMSYAYATKGCTLYQNQEVLGEIISALDHLCAKYYVKGQTGYGNWYHWEITSPTAMMNIVMVLYDELSSEELTRYTEATKWYVPYCDKGGPHSNGPKMTGGNLLLKANGVAQCGILMQDASMLDNVKAGVKTVLVNNDYSKLYSGDADGFYADGSYIQHQALPYIGGYGADLYNNLGVFLQILGGSDWAIAYDDQAENVAYDFIFSGMEPFIYEGHTMDMVSSRDVTRSSSNDHGRTYRLLQAILPLRGAFPTAEQNARFDAMVKYILSQDSTYYFGNMDSISAIMQGVKLLGDSSVAPRSAYTLTKTFAMDKTVHITDDFAFALSMHSNRTYGHELINNEGKRTWNSSDGMYYLYSGDDFDKYSDGFWATVDPTRLPGTTAEHIVFNNGVGDRTKNIYNWVGGTSLGENGAAGMHLRTLGTANSSTRNGTDAKKSWFMFGDRIVALGSGITSTTGNTVETIIDNSKLKDDGSNVVTIDGAAANLTGAPTTVTPGWMHLQGNTAGGNLGYFFPAAQPVTAIKESRTGDWSAQGTTTGTATNQYATFWFDHGANPSDASYQYVLLPGKTADQTAAYAAAPDVEILSNTNAIHAARDTANNVTAINFWEDAPATMAGVSVDRAASVVMQRSGNTVNLSVSDPTQQNTTIELMLVMPGTVTANDSNITVVESAPFVKLSIDTTGKGGQSSFATIEVEETTANEIVALSGSFEDIKVALKTSFTDLPLPTTATVTTSDMTTAEVGINWDRTGYNRLTAGTCTLTGTLVPPEGLQNTLGCKATIRVIVGQTTELAETDTYVRCGKYSDQVVSGANKGSGLSVKLDADISYVREALIRVSLANLPADYEKVTLNLTTGDPDTGFTGADLYRVSNVWDGATVTYAAMPARLSAAPAASFTAADAAKHHIPLDVTEAVRTALAQGESAISFEICATGTPGSKNQITISSVENGTEESRPYLSWNQQTQTEVTDKANLQLLVDAAHDLDASQFSNYDAALLDSALQAADRVLAEDLADMQEIHTAENTLADVLLALRLTPKPIV